MDNQLNQAFSLVSQHDNMKIKQGQAKLNQLRKGNNYPIGLLVYMNNHQNLQVQLRAAIQLKIWCQSYFSLEQFERQFYGDSIQDIKEKIIFAYLVFGGKISQTLRPAIVKLTNAQFPRNWGGLMTGLVQYASQNANSIQLVLLLIQDITYKYSYLSRSDPLFQEIIIVCDQIHDFLLQMTIKIIQTPNLDQGTLEILQTLMKIFYHLNYQDLHPKFQDNLSNWMGILKQVMNFENTNEAVFKCKGAALESILLYANKYKQDVEESIKSFSNQIWNLCSNATEDPDYDSIVFNSLKYFKSIILWAQMKQFFQDNLGQLIQKLIMPNLKINKNAIQMFYDQPDTFFDFYFKNNEILTRRSASLDLLRVICRNFPTYQAYVLHRIQTFTSDMPNASVLEKCSLLNFIIDGGSKSYRDVDGCTETYINIDLVVQCYEHIVKPDLASVYGWILGNQTKNIEDQLNMTLLVTLMRYCYFYRIYLSTDNYELIVKFSASINTNSPSVKTLVFMVINAFLTVRHGDFMHFKDLKYHFNSENTQLVAPDILQTIYKNDQAFTVLNQNLTRMLYTLAKTLGQASVQFYDYFDALFKQMLAKTEQYDFKSVLFLFQAIGTVAFWVAKADGPPKERLQNQILEYFQVAIKRDSDLLNFCFQILAIFLQFQNKKADKHKQIYDSILNLNNWVEQNMSIMSSYIQYISAYISRSPGNLISDKEKFQVILSRLVQLQHFDLFFRFLDSILHITNIDQYNESGYFKLSIMGTEAIIQKSILGKKLAVLFIFKMMTHHDINKVLGYMNAASATLFLNMITNSNDIIRTMQFRRDRKLMYGALCQVISLGILQPQIQGSLLSLLIDNSTNRFQIAGFRDSLQGQAKRQKKQSTYQKLQIFNQIQTKQTSLQIDQEEQLCKAYIRCQRSNRQSLLVLDPKNHQRMKRLIDKHSQSLLNFV